MYIYCDSNRSEGCEAEGLPQSGGVNCFPVTVEPEEAFKLTPEIVEDSDIILINRDIGFQAMWIIREMSSIDELEFWTEAWGQTARGFYCANLECG